MSAQNEKSLGQIAFEKFSRGVAQWQDLGVTERHNWDASAYAVADALRYQHVRGGDDPIPEDAAAAADGSSRSAWVRAAIETKLGGG